MSDREPPGDPHDAMEAAIKQALDDRREREAWERRKEPAPDADVQHAVGCPRYKPVRKYLGDRADGSEIWQLWCRECQATTVYVDGIEWSDPLIDEARLAAEEAAGREEDARRETEEAARLIAIAAAVRRELVEAAGRWIDAHPGNRPSREELGGAFTPVLTERQVRERFTAGRTTLAGVIEEALLSR